MKNNTNNFKPIFATDEAFVSYDAFNCGDLERVPVYFEKDCQRHFVINMPHEYKSRHDHGGFYDLHLKEGRKDVENYFKQLNSNGGKYIVFHCINNNGKTLQEFLDWVKDNGYTFDKDMTDFIIDKDYVDFHGNLNEYSAAFYFRIYDKTLAASLMDTIDAPKKDFTK